MPRCQGVRVTEDQAMRYEEAIASLDLGSGSTFYELTVDVVETISPHLSEGMRDIVRDVDRNFHGDFLQGFLDAWTLIVIASLQYRQQD